MRVGESGDEGVLFARIPNKTRRKSPPNGRFSNRIFRTKTTVPCSRAANDRRAEEETGYTTRGTSWAHEGEGRVIERKCVPRARFTCRRRTVFFFFLLQFFNFTGKVYEDRDARRRRGVQPVYGTAHVGSARMRDRTVSDLVRCVARQY